MPGDRLALTDFLEKTETALRDLLAVAAAGEASDIAGTMFFPTADAALEAAEGLTPMTLIRAIDAIENAVRSLSLNVNVYSAQMALLTSLASA